MTQLPTQIEVTFGKVREYHKKQVPNALWEYHIEEANGDVYGFAGGLLTKDGQGSWVAHYWEYAKGAPARTREAAVLNVLPLAAKIVEESRAQQAEYARVYDARMSDASELAATFQPHNGEVIRVHDTTACREKQSPDARFTVTITYDNLTRAEVEGLSKAH
jgi:hypothetical protein